jgi:hypothetical protein
VIAQIRAHPAVERVIPTCAVYAFDMAIPPVGSNYPAETYSVSTEDMAYLVDLYHLKLAEGRLPRPNANEIVLPWAAAKNRGLKVGDVIGDRDRPLYAGAPTLPSELVVSGIFARAENPAEETWLSFMSLEYIRDYQQDWKTSLSLIVVPKAGQRAALDGWLENEIDGERHSVRTYGSVLAFFDEIMKTGLFTFSLMESVIAVVAALALAGLNYIFITQRQAEFGVLNALGFTRLQLIWRVVREAFFTTGAAWLGGALACAVIVAYLQYGVYDPIGLRLNFLNPAPWLFTLPVPAAVFAVSAGAMAWMFSRLDPVAVIERR